MTSPDKFLFAFRTLLIPEAMFGIAVFEPARSSNHGLGDAYDLILSGRRVRDDGLPIVPHHTSKEFPSVAADLLAAAWYSHLQQVAELLGSAMRHLDRGHLIVAAVLARTALEVAERTFAFTAMIRTSSNDEQLSELVQEFLTGDRSPSPSISQGIKAMHEAIGEEHAWESSSEDSLYSRLCNLTHPHEQMATVYTVHAADGVRMNPPSDPLWTDIAWVKAGSVALLGAVVAGEGMRSSWHSVNEVRLGLVSRDLTAEVEKIQLRADFVHDQLGHLGARNAQTFLPESTMMLYRRPGQDYLGPGENRLASMLRNFEKTHLALGYFGESERNATQGWAWLRVRVLLEMELAIAEHLNRGEVISSAALSRFALEHATSLFDVIATVPGQRIEALLSYSKGRAGSLQAVLERSGASSPPDFGAPRTEGATAGQIARQGLNAFVHPSMTARKIYWKRFGGSENHDDVALFIPGHPMHLATYSSEDNFDLDNPWSASVATLDVIESQGILALALVSSTP